MIWNFIKEQLRIAATEGKKSLDFPIVGYRVIRNPITGQYIYIEKSDYKTFVFWHRLRYEINRDWYYKVPNRITIFF